MKINIRQITPNQILSFGLGTLVVLMTFFLIYMASFSKKETEASYNPYHLTMSQLKMQEAYGWKDVILWIESKEDFEKAYGKKLNWMNYPMGFRKDPLCCEPYGCSGNWDLEKCCYNYVVVANIPDMLEKIANESKGKTLVVIGNTYRINDGENFMGNAYWCE